MEEAPWYQDGLPFNCTGCGKCCTGFPGYVWVEEDEIKAIAGHLNLTIDELAQKYLRTAYGEVSLREDPQDFDCVFLKEKKFCSIYPVRPKQCRTYPFWPINLSSKEAWESAASECEGIRESSVLVPFGAIQEKLKLHEE